MHHRRIRLAALLVLAGWSPARAEPATLPFVVREAVRLVHHTEARNWRSTAIEALKVRIWYPADDVVSEPLREG